MITQIAINKPRFMPIRALIQCLGFFTYLQIFCFHYLLAMRGEEVDKHIHSCVHSSFHAFIFLLSTSYELSIGHNGCKDE